MDKIPESAVDSTEVELLHEDFEGGYPIVAYPNRDHTDVPVLVADRIEVSGVYEHVDVPEPGERVSLGEVAWDDDGFPVRLECENGVVVAFSEGKPSIHVPNRG